MKRLLPFIGSLADLGKRLRGRKPEVLAVYCLYRSRFELGQARSNRNQVGVHQLDKGPAQQKIEPNECQQGCGIVEHSARGLFHFAALLDEISLQDFAEAAECPQLLDHLLERLAP